MRRLRWPSLYRQDGNESKINDNFCLPGTFGAPKGLKELRWYLIDHNYTFVELQPVSTSVLSNLQEEIDSGLENSFHSSIFFLTDSLLVTYFKDI